MKAIFEKIWRLALPYQDKRNDKGHARIVLDFALKLVRMEKADENVVVPAAILHDIGWSQLPKKERLKVFVTKVNKETDFRIRRKHERLGVKLAKRILEKANYGPDLIGEILKIISRHDTRKSFVSANEGIVRDADKLWRYSRTGFGVDTKRAKGDSTGLYKKLKQRIGLKEFFYSGAARKIARKELKKRKAEYGII
jgi:HD superfamily phosphodiesterase